jgi:hypothetical protein
VIFKENPDGERQEAGSGAGGNHLTGA